MRVIGIDPGTATTGYGIIDAVDGVLSVVSYGVIETSADALMSDRLLKLHDDLSALLTLYQPIAAGVEELFFGRNITTAITVGQARGVILLAIAQAGIPMAEYSPPKVKQAVAGYGNASKSQIQLMVRHLLELEELPRPDDAADGLAIAITHYYHQRYAELTEQP